MRFYIIVFSFFFHNSKSELWTQGIVHYSINQKDYDVHSREIINNELGAIQNEICVKFFEMPTNMNNGTDYKMLFITNPHKIKTCSSQALDYNKDVVNMPIGYNCLSSEGITRVVVDMLKGSIRGNIQFRAASDRALRSDTQTDIKSRLSAEDRNFINDHYKEECGKLQDRKPLLALRSENTKLADLTLSWPLGIVMYGVDTELRYSKDLQIVEEAMRMIEMSSCVVFKKFSGDEESYVIPKNMVWFGNTGAEEPAFGFQAGNQSLSLKAMVHGAPGHAAHSAVMLLRILGLPMVSNRFDRDDFVKIHWENVQQGKEHLFEKQKPVKSLEPYDYDSITHAPANFACKNCENGELTVEPVQDILWQRTLSIGHGNQLSPRDKADLNDLYHKECSKYFPTNNNNLMK